MSAPQRHGVGVTVAHTARATRRCLVVSSPPEPDDEAPTSAKPCDTSCTDDMTTRAASPHTKPRLQPASWYWQTRRRRLSLGSSAVSNFLMRAQHPRPRGRPRPLVGPAAADAPPATAKRCPTLAAIASVRARHGPAATPRPFPRALEAPSRSCARGRRLIADSNGREHVQVKGDGGGDAPLTLLVDKMDGGRVGGGGWAPRATVRAACSVTPSSSSAVSASC